MNKFSFLIAGLLFLLACGETPSTDQTSVGESAMESYPAAVAVSTNVATTEEELAPQRNLQTAEAELRAEVNESEEMLDDEEMDYENVENPTPKKKILVKALEPAEKEASKEETEAPKLEDQNKEVEIVAEAAAESTETTPATASTNTEEPSAKVEKPEKEVITFNHDVLDGLLRKHVSSTGKVNYQAFKEDEAQLDAYLKTLAETSLDRKWSKAKQMAYYINAYNAATIKLILKNWPVNKITDLHGGKPWDVKWVNLGGKTYSLNAIENDILRPRYNDARIHFAVNCAAKSCPPLLNKAWTESNLNRYLDQQARSFINNSAFNKISAANVEISKIFDWYAKDFGDITDYLNQFSTTKINDDASVSYKEYNWALNN